MTRPRDNPSSNLPGGDKGALMPDSTEPVERNREIASALKRHVLEELGEDSGLDDAAVEALVRGIASLFQSPSVSSRT